jgi:hypothetical protein
MNIFMNETIARLAADKRLRPSHVSLYVAMAVSGVYAASDALLAQAKVSLTTFYRCVRDLKKWGYLN